jgi:ribosomal protein L18
MGQLHEIFGIKITTNNSSVVLVGNKQNNRLVYVYPNPNKLVPQFINETIHESTVSQFSTVNSNFVNISGITDNIDSVEQSQKVGEKIAKNFFKRKRK